MSIFIKICGLRDAESVAAAVDAGTDAVGFVFADSARQVTPAEANAAATEIPDDVMRVAVMRHPSNDDWTSVLEVFGPDVLQTDIEDFDSLDVPGHILTWPVIREGSVAAAAELPEVFVYEGKNSGTGEAVDWSNAVHMADRGRMILAGGLAADNVATAIKTARPWGIDVSSGVELAPGRKDVKLIEQFIIAARAVEND
jgi:phosphoribosylanthranilate isomerase